MRTLTETTKVRTQFGNLFAHVDKEPSGRVVSIGFSVQGRMKDSTIGNALDALSEAINQMIEGEQQHEHA